MRYLMFLLLITVLVASSVTLAQDGEVPEDIEELAFAGVEGNDEWEPYIHELDDVKMVLVPAGCFMMGSEDGPGDEEPVHEQCIEEPYWIDLTEVTRGMYAECVAEEACKERPSESLGSVLNEASRDGQPQANVTWFDATDYCAWREARLPTEREWEYAARGPDNLVYPWGNEFVEDNVVYAGNNEGETADVGSRPEGASWVGALDMSGNVWEWTSTIYSDFAYPYDAGDGREAGIDADDADRTRLDMNDTDNVRVYRGGSLLYPEAFLRTADRNKAHPLVKGNDLGFRCAQSY